MALSINQNIMAMNSYRNLTATQNGLGKSLEKLSSGFRINRAADDAAGLGISEGLRAQVHGNKQAVRNAQDGISLVQTAEGALNEVHSMLQRMRTLAVQGANDSNSASNRKSINDELRQLTDEIGRIANVTEFNGTKLLNNADKSLNFQVGANADEDLTDPTKTLNVIKVKTADITAAKDALNTEVDKLKAFEPTVDAGTGAVTIPDQADATKTYQGLLKAVDAQITKVSETRGEFGAVQNRFEHTINNLNVAVENLSASESRIRDTDMAEEMMAFTKNQILSQAGTAMLAQANQVPQTVLSLLR